MASRKRREKDVLSPRPTRRNVIGQTNPKCVTTWSVVLSDHGRTKRLGFDESNDAQDNGRRTRVKMCQGNGTRYKVYSKRCSESDWASVRRILPKTLYA